MTLEQKRALALASARLRAQQQNKAQPVAEETQKPFGEQLRNVAISGARGLLMGGPLGAVTGTLSEANRQTADAFDKYAYRAGGAVTDALSGVASPEVAAGAGFAANVATQAVPVVLGGEAGKLASPAFRAGARTLMQSAIKPTIKDLKTGKAAKAIDTLLEEGISPTRGGVEKLKGLADDLDDQIKSAIANSPATIKKSDVGRRLQDTFEKFKNQVTPDADLNTLKNAWLEFRNHPLLAGKTDIPVQVAQDLKRGTYKQLSNKYGQLGSADIEAQKALARGLKEEISAAVPGVAGMNQRQSDLINALNVAERRALMEANKNPMGLSLLADHPGTWAAFLADRSAALKALAARGLYAGRDQIPGVLGRVAGGALAAPEAQYNGILAP